MKVIAKKSIAVAEQLMQYIDSSPTPFHAVQTTVALLQEAGFEELSEQDQWEQKPGGCYYTIREDTSITAWIAGKKSPAESGFRIIGAHTDSPNLRLKPKPNVVKHGYQQLGVEMYGGVLLSSWADRDLSLAGRVLVGDAANKTLSKQFIRLDRPFLRIPLLCIHLNKEVNTKGLVLNPQKHLLPIMGLESKDPDPLRRLLADELKVDSDKIIDFDLSLYDVQPSSFLGAQSEFIAAPRLDNLCSCFCGLQALIAISRQKSTPSVTCVMTAFDHEEIGSQSAQGARSSFLKNTLKRIVRLQTKSGAQDYERAVASSIFLSADMAHAVHPNFPDVHEPQHFPLINQGPVIKTNAQGRYATNGHSSAHFELVCRRKKIPVQKFVNRTDLSCGSTIGPFVAGDLGMSTLDVGGAMLSMHSIREMCGTLDPQYTVEAFKGFLVS